MKPTKPLNLQFGAVLFGTRNAPKNNNIFGPILSSLVKTLHPPIITPGESQKLLNLVRTSFRDNLAATQSTDDAYTPNAHIASILKIFSGSGPRQTREVSIQKMLKDPIGTYEEQVALGTATSMFANACFDRYVTIGGAVPGSDGGLRAIKALLASNHTVTATTKIKLLVLLALERRDNFILGMFHADKSLIIPGLNGIEIGAGSDRAAEIFLNLVDKDSLSPDFSTLGVRLLKSTKSASIKERMLHTSSIWARSSFDYAMIQLRYGHSIDAGLRYLRFGDKYGSTTWWANQSKKQKTNDIKLSLELWKLAMKQGREADADFITRTVYKRYKQDQVADIEPGTSLKDLVNEFWSGLMEKDVGHRPVVAT